MGSRNRRNIGVSAAREERGIKVPGLHVLLPNKLSADSLKWAKQLGQEKLALAKKRAEASRIAVVGNPSVEELIAMRESLKRYLTRTKQPIRLLRQPWKMSTLVFRLVNRKIQITVSNKNGSRIIKDSAEQAYLIKLAVAQLSK